MSDCPYNSRLGALYDGELSDELSREVRQHVASCRSCTAHLQELSKLSSALGQIRFLDLAPRELACIHAGLQEEVEHGGDRGILRLAGMLSAVAASVLIISLAWLSQAPGSGNRQMVVAPSTQPAESWERLASGDFSSPAAPKPAGVPDTGVAESDTIDFMLNGVR